MNMRKIFCITVAATIVFMTNEVGFGQTDKGQAANSETGILGIEEYDASTSAPAPMATIPVRMIGVNRLKKSEVLPNIEGNFMSKMKSELFHYKFQEMENPYGNGQIIHGMLSVSPIEKLRKLSPQELKGVMTEAGKALEEKLAEDQRLAIKEIAEQLEGTNDELKKVEEGIEKRQKHLDEMSQRGGWGELAKEHYGYLGKEILNVNIEKAELGAEIEALQKKVTEAKPDPALEAQLEEAKKGLTVLSEKVKYAEMQVNSGQVPGTEILNAKAAASAAKERVIALEASLKQSSNMHKLNDRITEAQTRLAICEAKLHLIAGLSSDADKVLAKVPEMERVTLEIEREKRKIPALDDEASQLRSQLRKLQRPIHVVMTNEAIWMPTERKTEK